MKYEMIFGNDKLFNGAPDDAVLVSAQLGDFSYFTEENLQVCKKFNIYKLQTCDTQLAMRRIIREPKRWTAEDQKAGRLPEVGAEVQFNFYQSAVMRQGVIKYIDDQVVVIQTEDVTRPFCYETCKVVFTPIETPEEKAERLRNEWINEAINAVRKTDVNGYESIYDALLSGELPVPTKGGE